MTARSRWRRPLLGLAAGAVLLLVGIAWAVVTGVAVPYPDPTTAMKVYEERHLMISNFFLSGGLVLALGSLVWLVVAVVRRRPSA